MTATSSQGLALMAEVVYIASAMRAPIVTALGNRALSGPINIHCDHSDSMLIRDSGVVQLFVENAQEAYDATILAPRLAEHPEVLLPVFVCLDGFTITHSAEPVELLDDTEVQRFVGDYRIPFPLLDAPQATTQGPFAMPDYYFELKHQQVAAMATAGEVLDQLVDELEGFTGRRYEPLERYRLDDAARAIVLMGSSAGTAKDVVDELRNRHQPVGLLRIGSFRPFPAEGVREALHGVADAAVLDRADSPGGAPPLFAEVAAANDGRARLRSVVYGLGGRELHPEDIEGIFGSLRDRAPATPTYAGLRSAR
jgi:pyruvate ferredoxin oxidoreductase alpha subunit